ncbi:FG-GAP repeat domain protein [Synechococcus sp. PCC 7335]|uniref:CRTAC1 family protein n=1 Tax=Synechococcus sp. (strain ATCC 29403 / PCC 7335) TaxID=91464 RepID=UPI00017EB407|nr:CRTAC1 family protein [Synechococcus sp. PCC 7335]EDX85065.1 FG-GAP repeat domain protein [Synechococcus sp. PCC 7335]
MIKSLKKHSILKGVVLTLIAFAIALMAHAIYSQQGAERLALSTRGQQWFESQELLSDVPALFDIGVTDINQDGDLDVYTSNHSEKQFLLFGQTDGTFDERPISSLSLNQDPDFPGLEPAAAPVMDEPGVYIYWDRRRIVIECKDLASLLGPSAGSENFGSGTIQVSSPMNVIDSNGFDIDIQEEELASGAIISTTQFSIDTEEAKTVLGSYNQSLPVSLELNTELSLNQIYVGVDKVNPAAYDFTMYLRDRHGMAWADYDGQGFLDVFIVRGGLRARMETLPERYTDELLVDSRVANSEETTYTNIVDDVGIEKKACPALQTAWVDFNADGLLDIYTVCFTPPTATRSYANQLYQQLPHGRFRDVASDVGLDITDDGSFVWLDANRDRAVDLIWVGEEAFWLYLNQDGKFEPRRIGDNPGTVVETFSDSSKLTVADYDNDGDLDVFFASPGGNALLSNDQGNYVVLDLESLQLPTRSYTANWVDYDNDGRADLHVAPDGLYRQTTAKTFEPVQLLGEEATLLQKAFATWFDANNDGRLDLLWASSYRPSKLQSLYQRISQKILGGEFTTESSAVTLYSGVGGTSADTQNHWLQLDLTGSAKNRQAIGALVELITAEGTQLQTVGQFEGSQFSQGHYRLYFGVGKQQSIDLVRVYWPDGSSQEVQDVDADQRLTISQANEL